MVAVTGSTIITQSAAGLITLYSSSGELSLHLPQPASREPYLTLVRSHLSYCSKLW